MLYNWIYSLFPLKKGMEQYNALAAQILILRDSWGSKSDSDFDSLFEEHTNAWVDLVNRDRLHHVSYKFHLFIKTVKMEARTILNQELLINYCGEDLKTLLYNTFSKNENIEVCLYNITQNISNLSIKVVIKKRKNFE